MTQTRSPTRALHFPSLTAPAATPRDSQHIVHGKRLTDEYSWLRASNWQDVLKSPSALPEDIRTHLEAENAYAAAMLANTAVLRRDLAGEMRGRILEDDTQPPFPDGPFQYYERYRQGGEHAVICRQPRGGGDEAVLLDGDAESRGHDFFHLGNAEHSPDHRLLAWAADMAGSEFETIRTRDLSTGRDIDEVQDTTGTMVWLKDSQSYIYVRLDENHRGNRVFLHRIGTPASADILLYEEADAGFYVSIGQTQDGAYAYIDIHDHETSEIRLIDPADPQLPRLVEARATGHRYSVDHHAGDLVILTNCDGAEDFQIVRAPLATPDRANWRPLVPGLPGRLISRMTCLSRHLVWLERDNAVPALKIREWASGAVHAVAFDEPTYALGYSPGYEYDTDRLRFTYSSLARPAETYDYDLASRNRVLIKRRQVPSGHDPERYEVMRIEARAADGAQVPVSVLKLKETPADGTAPCLLYGYGAYGIVIPAGFRSNVLSLVDRGFVYAIAHVRGGMDKGYRWYRDGKLEKKTNTFTDFIAAAEALVTGSLVARDRIVAQGGSAGGLTMGAIANLRPDLFAGIIAEVPFVDTLTTMMDGSLPLTPPEWPEWGNPIESAEAFATILGYSPYDNVSAQAYPAMLVEAGLTDPRVTYWEPAKWVARLRARMTGGGPILLNTNMAAGHGGASGRLKQLEDDARAYAFALAVVGKA